MESLNPTTYRDRYNRLEDAAGNFEQARSGLVKELIEEVERLSSEYRREHLDLMREAQFNRDNQIKEQHLRGEYEHMKEEYRLFKASMDRNPFILVLIDGDGMIFENELLRAGEQGGREAANQLYTVVREYISYELKDLSNYKVVTRVYANLKGLAETIYRWSVVDHPHKVVDFARGFTNSRHLFDFVDVGMGKDRADDKLTEIFKLNIEDFHCKTIIFGCSHDNGYARILEEYHLERDRIALLEGVPFEREIAKLKTQFKTAKFEGLFRTTKLVVNPAQQLQNIGAPEIIRSASNGGNSGAYAAAAAIPPTPIAARASTPPTVTTQGVSRNRWGQRIDGPVMYDKQLVQRLKGVKLCNSHYLRGDCPYNPCSHDHSYKPSKAEVATLRCIARMAPCRHGSDCDDPKCIYGHMCPAGDPCPFGPNCRYPDDLHVADTNIVKAIRV